MEIERKFLVRTLPGALETFPAKRIEQGYLSTEPVVRVRRKGEEYLLTYKGKGLLEREEVELPLTEAAYRHLLSKADGLVISKTRYHIPFGERTIELDVFDPPLAPLVLAEVEFPDRAAAEGFTPPDWFGQEVTYDPAYQNSALSQRGRP